MKLTYIRKDGINNSNINNSSNNNNITTTMNNNSNNNNFIIKKIPIQTMRETINIQEKGLVKDLREEIEQLLS